MKIFIFIFLLVIIITLTAYYNYREFKLPKDSIEKLEKLIFSNPDDKGFIIFTGKSDSEYVQFALEKHGLLFNWPIINNNLKKDSDYAIKIENLLKNMGYNKLDVETVDGNIIEKINYKEYVIDFNGIYANFGINAVEIKDITYKIFKDIYLYNRYTKIKIDLELSGI